MYAHLYYYTSRYISIGGNAIALLRNVNVCAAECDVFEPQTYTHLLKRASDNKATRGSLAFLSVGGPGWAWDAMQNAHRRFPLHVICINVEQEQLPAAEHNKCIDCLFVHCACVYLCVYTAALRLRIFLGSASTVLPLMLCYKRCKQRGRCPRQRRHAGAHSRET